MAKHYAIELSLMLYHEEQWVRGMTYYNHGETPPFGGVRSDETTEPLVLELEEFESNVLAVEDWRRHVVNVVRSISPIPKDGMPEMPLEYSVDFIAGVDEEPDLIVYRLVMASMEIVATYDKSAKTVTFDPRSNFDVSWRGFLFHQDTMIDFLEEIKG